MDTQISTLKAIINSRDNIKIYRDNDGNIIIDGNVIIYDKDYDRFPVKIHKINGDLHWAGNMDGLTSGSLASLENFPDIVTGNVFIHKNKKLTSLNGCPKEIGKSLVCDYCNITDISGIAKNIGKNFVASNNPIKYISVLENVYVGGNINLANTTWSNITEDKNIHTLNDSSIIITTDTTNNIFD